MVDIKYGIDEESDTDDGDAEGGSSGGSLYSTEQWEEYLRAYLTWERRQEQKKIAPIPFTERPERVLEKKSPRKGGGACPHPHPLLAGSQQFSGDDPKLTANPVENPEAIERFPQLRLENELRKQRNLGLARKRNITPSPR